MYIGRLFSTQTAHQAEGLDTNRSAIGYEQLNATVQHGEIGPVLALAKHVVKAKAHLKNQSGSGTKATAKTATATASLATGTANSIATRVATSTAREVLGLHHDALSNCSKLRLAKYR